MQLTCHSGSRLLTILAVRADSRIDLQSSRPFDARLCLGQKLHVHWRERHHSFPLAVLPSVWSPGLVNCAVLSSYEVAKTKLHLYPLMSMLQATRQS